MIAKPLGTGSFLPFLAGTALSLGLLWWLQSVLVPIALAVFLTFLLSPPVYWLQRRGMPRAPAVILMILGSLALGGSIAWTVAVQINRLVDTFPEYQKHLDAKITSVHSNDHGFLDKVQAIVARVSTQLDKASELPPARNRAPGQRAPAVPADPPPQPVTIVENSGPFNIGLLWRTLVPLLEPLATGSLTLVLVIFMLFRREDLRDRVIAVLGRARLVATTRAFDDAGNRISRYLVRQLVINCSFGFVLGIGLTLIGVPYAILWSALTALLRYVPYLGTWLSAIMPVAMSLVLTDGWQPVFHVLALFLVLELITNMFLEPRLYGQGVGVSETGTLVMVAFWTWLWGPVGLVLATPLTVCAVVLGKYVPSFRYFNMLLGDRPALAPDVSFYQRLLADDAHEAFLIARQALSTTSFARVCDQLMRPALAYLGRDVAQDRLSEAEARRALQVCEQVAQQLVEEPADKGAAAPPVPATTRHAVLAIATSDAASEAAMHLFERVLIGRPFEVTVAPGSMLVSEVSQQIARVKPSAVVIGVVSESALSHARLLCLRLRAADARLPIVVGLWTTQRQDEGDLLRERLIDAGADYTVDSFDEARAHLETIRLLEPSPTDEARPPLSAA
jgi:predicted PurR-regulated permease PerM